MSILNTVQDELKNNPVETIEKLSSSMKDTFQVASTIAIGVASLSVAINRLLVSSKVAAANQHSEQTGDTHMEQFYKSHSSNKERIEIELNPAPFTKSSMELLERIAKTRNSYFRKLTPEEQYDVLRMEGYSVKLFLINENRAKSPVYIPPMTEAQFRKINFKSEDGYYYTQYDRMKQDPKRFWRKMFGFKVAELKDEDINHFQPLDSTYQGIHCEDIAAVKICQDNLNKYKGLIHESDIARYIKRRSAVSPEVDREIEAIKDEELLRHTNIQDYQKAVEKRVFEEGLNRSILDMMTQYENDKANYQNRSQESYYKPQRENQRGRRDYYYEPPARDMRFGASPCSQRGRRPEYEAFNSGYNSGYARQPQRGEYGRNDEYNDSAYPRGDSYEDIYREAQKTLQKLRPA